MSEESIKLGMNARLFPNCWRPLAEEISFAQNNKFQSIQISVRDRIIDPEFLGDGLNVVAKQLEESKIDLAIELLIQINIEGKTKSGQIPLDVLKSNLSAINQLQCNYVHWHLVPLREPTSINQALPGRKAIHKLEERLIPQFHEAVEIAEKHHFEFGFEHNEPELMLFAFPESCQKLIDSVNGLKFVWDTNHTIPEHLPEIQKLVSKGSIIHVSDTVLPEVNYHLPLGHGNVDFTQIAKILLDHGYSGPAIFEVGGLKKSGGYGKDTDETLIQSRNIFQKAIELARADVTVH